MDVEMRGSVVDTIPQDPTAFGMGLGSAELKIWGGKDAWHLAWQTEGEAIDARGSPNGGTQKGPTCQAGGLAMVTVG